MVKVICSERKRLVMLRTIRKELLNTKKHKKFLSRWEDSLSWWYHSYIEESICFNPQLCVASYSMSVFLKTLWLPHELKIWDGQRDSEWEAVSIMILKRAGVQEGLMVSMEKLLWFQLSVKIIRFERTEVAVHPLWVRTWPTSSPITLKGRTLRPDPRARPPLLSGPNPHCLAWKLILSSRRSFLAVLEGP